MQYNLRVTNSWGKRRVREFEVSITLILSNYVVWQSGEVVMASPLKEEVCTKRKCIPSERGKFMTGAQMWLLKAL